ncbi:single-stranded DNA-binding protein [Altericroceibacterium spongiae]|uniref:Single-stranded DNA-binding protein n=1 Tax=Altericroceibacterium spongiae TaxID=2320269 RepID=A0A420EAR9_9SPHN|nr:single-stranded DNA-binding protein [Altericroceibacterium spongiae]RKF17742.1 single-stranded DNA-binding protein [Altericroceibacterium spongiae]
MPPKVISKRRRCTSRFPGSLLPDAFGCGDALCGAAFQASSRKPALRAYGFRFADPPFFNLPAASPHPGKMRQQRHGKRRLQMQFAKFEIIGNVGKIESLDKVTFIDIATNTAYRDDNGEWVEKTIWNRVSVFGKQRERAEKLNTGDQIYAEGEIERTSYTKDNDRVFVTNLKVFRFGVLSRK